MSYDPHYLQFRVELVEGRGEDLSEKKKIIRKIQVGDIYDLDYLAEAIVNAYDFNLDHCFGFYDYLDPRKQKEVYELFTDLPDVEHTPGALGVEDVDITKVFDQDGKKMYFLFDYGDGWKFIVKRMSIEKGRRIHPRVIFRDGKKVVQYPPCDEEIELEENGHWLSDDCPICRKLKKKGVKIRWCPDET